MNKIYQILWIVFLVFSCKEDPSQSDSTHRKVEFNQILADELKSMAEIDQLAASNFVPPTTYSHLSLEEWESFQDSVYTTHQLRLKEIFKEHGFVGFDLAGEEGSRNFWLMAQHSDQYPQFQKEVLKKMKMEVDKKNADSSIYGLLVDRVKINTGQPQIYGTQVDYKMNPCQAFPKNLVDPENVNKRRKEIGLQPIEEYLNMMTLMNCDRLKKLEAKKQELN
jgi:hypothetical protein